MCCHRAYLEHNYTSDPCLFHVKQTLVCHEILNGVWEAIYAVWEAIHEPRDTENPRSTNYQPIKCTCDNLSTADSSSAADPSVLGSMFDLFSASRTSCRIEVASTLITLDTAQYNKK